MPTALANRYARALADVVASSGTYRQVLNELEDFGAAYRETPEKLELADHEEVTIEPEDPSQT